MLTALRIVLFIVVAAIVGVSFGQNGYYWFRQMEAEAVARWLFVGFSVASGVLKLAVPLYVERAQVRWIKSPSLALVFGIAVVFELWSGFGFNGMARDDARAATDKTANERGDLERKRDKLIGEFDKIGEARASVIVDSLIPQAKREAGECKTKTDAATEACKKWAALTAEFAAAKERDRVAGELEAVRGKLSQLTAKGPEGQGAPIARTLKSFTGIEVSNAILENVWAFLMLGFIELVPVAVLTSLAKPLPAPRVPDKVASAPVSAPIVVRKRPANPSSVLEAIEQAAATPGGWVYLSQDAWASRIGSSKSTVNRQIKDGLTAGELEIDNSKRPAGLRVAA